MLKTNYKYFEMLFRLTVVYTNILLMTHYLL